MRSPQLCDFADASVAICLGDQYSHLRVESRMSSSCCALLVIVPAGVVYQARFISLGHRQPVSSMPGQREERERNSIAAQDCRRLHTAVTGDGFDMYITGNHQILLQTSDCCGYVRCCPGDMPVKTKAASSNSVDNPATQRLAS
jgi:hypothetical protein